MQNFFVLKNVILSFTLLFLLTLIAISKNFILIIILLSGIIIILSAFAIVLKTPYYLLFLVPIGSYMGYFIQIFKDSPVPFSLFQIFLVLFFMVYIFHKIIRNDFTLTRTNFEAEFLIFFLLISLSLLYSPNRAEGLFYSFRIIVLIIMFYLIVDNIRNFKQIKYILLAVILISTILAILSIREGFLNPERILWDYFSMGRKLISRAMVNQLDPNIFASHFFLPILFLASFIFQREIDFKKRFIGFIFFMIILLGLLSTFSRSAWISVIFGILVLVFFYKQYKILILFVVASLAILIFIPYSRIVLSNIISRFYNIFAGEVDPSTAIRILLGFGAIHMILDSFLLGIGFRGFPEVITRYYSMQELDRVLEPHSVFYAIFAELGLIGFLIYCWIIFKIAYIAYQNFKISSLPLEKIISSSLFTSFIAYIIFYEFYGGGLVDNNLWIIISLILSTHFILEKSVKNRFADL